MLPLTGPLARVRSFWRNLFSKDAVERDLDENVRSYTELLAAEKRRDGMGRDEALRAARIEVGGAEHIKEAVRDARSSATLETTIQDARYAVRSLLRRPGFTIVAVTALALGIGATTSIFSVVNGVLLRPLPYHEPDRLVAVMHDVRDPVAPANYLDWKRQNTVFSGMGAAEYWAGNLTGDVPERVQGLRITSDIVSITGVRPVIGRAFGPEDDAPGGERPVLVSWSFWQSRFAGRQDVVGQRVVVDGESYSVIGVMPRGFDFPMFWATGVQLWTPLALGERATSRTGSSLRVFARLRPGVTLEAARVQMSTITANLEQAFPGTNRGVTVTPHITMVVGDVQAALFVLLGAVGFVLLIACANVAHMLMARATVRQREMTVRFALGASRRRLVRQLLTESVILAIMSGVIGVVLARIGLQALIALAGDSVPRADDIALDPWVLVFTAAISVVTGVAFGLVPAMRVTRSEMAEALRDGARGSTESADRGRLRSLLAGSEIALALVLLTGAGLAIRTFVALRAIDPGFDPRGVLSAVVTIRGTPQAPPERRLAFYESVLERVRLIPGVESASFINHLPIAGDIWGTPFRVDGRPRPQPGELPTAAFRVVLPGYFAAMGLPVRRGRDVAASDRLDAPPVVVVNEFFANRWWPNEDAIGKRITLDTDANNPMWVTVIGVTKNAVRSDWAAPPEEEMYLPFLQSRGYLQGEGAHRGYMTLVVRAACTPGARCAAGEHVPAVRQAVASLDRAVPVTEVQTMLSVIDGATARPRFTLVLLATFAAVALVLATIGIYGVISYAVSRRTHEIGVRMALGASPASVLSLIIGQGMRVVLGGVVVGLAGSLLVTRLMTSVVYGVQVTDPLTYSGVAALLVGVALVASYIPARRATRIGPLTAMRAD